VGGARRTSGFHSDPATSVPFADRPTILSMPLAYPSTLDHHYGRFDRAASCVEEFWSPILTTYHRIGTAK
jgi:hypothetical protein